MSIEAPQAPCCPCGGSGPWACNNFEVQVIVAATVATSPVGMILVCASNCRNLGCSLYCACACIRSQHLQLPVEFVNVPLAAEERIWHPHNRIQDLVHERQLRKPWSSRHPLALPQVIPVCQEKNKKTRLRVLNLKSHFMKLIKRMVNSCTFPMSSSPRRLDHIPTVDVQVYKYA